MYLFSIFESYSPIFCTLICIALYKYKNKFIFINIYNDFKTHNLIPSCVKKILRFDSTSFYVDKYFDINNYCLMIYLSNWIPANVYI